MSLTDFKTNFSGGTRQNRFLVQGNFPGNGSVSKFHVIAASVPASSSKSLEYDYYGRKWRYPGEKEYSPWNITIVDDHGSDLVNLWKYFNSWQNMINNHESNVSKIISTGAGYKMDNWSVQHLGINGDTNITGGYIKPLKKFILNGCWPAKISGLPFDMTRINTLNSFTVTLVFDTIAISGVTKENSGSVTQF